MFPRIANRISQIKVHHNRYGLRATFKKTIERGVYKPLYTRYQFRKFGDKYPQNIIYIVAFAKSGSTWVANQFASLKGFTTMMPSRWGTSIASDWETSTDDYRLYPGIFNEFKNKLVVVKGHTWATQANLQVLSDSGLKYLITLRDPRDKIVSEYWYLRNRHEHWNHQLAKEKTLGEYITYKLESGEFEREVIEWIRLWLNNRSETRSRIIKYEDLLRNPHDIIAEALNFLEFKITSTELDRIIAENRFEKQSGRKTGDENTKSFLRKGISGEWKQVFDNEQKQLFASVAEDVIKKLDYEPTL